ncbi:PTS transporter subunit EIIA [Lactobacillus johnsonii]|uniref:PTS transporter subunit EIIA n=1 Tax=Lactobacillus johnsonii TaxID=33959 RepID=A0A9X7Y6V5_LACJH|nr:PTS transporter subunit EIIA [Lactobacillus johnsonii]
MKVNVESEASCPLGLVVKDSKIHLQYLSNTAKLLTYQYFIEKLKQTKTPKEIKALFVSES